jgi:hypothetical protein
MLQMATRVMSRPEVLAVLARYARIAAAAAAFACPAVAQTAVVAGSLVDRTSRLPVEGARVAVLGTGLGASTDPAGRFELTGVPSGVRVVQIRAIGYAVGSWMVELGDGQVLRQVFELEARAIQLDSITVTAIAHEGWRSEAGFDERRARRIGFFLGRQEIQQRQANTIGDLMRVVPGLMTTCNGRNCVIRMQRGTHNCQPEYFLDGYPATFATGPNFPIAQIRGVEIYRDRFETPAEFQRPNLQCGVIAIWTVEPGTPLERR